MPRHFHNHTWQPIQSVLLSWEKALLGTGREPKSKINYYDSGCPLPAAVRLKVSPGTGFQDLVTHMLIISLCNAGSPVTWQESLWPSQTLEQVCAYLAGKIDHHWRDSRFFPPPCPYESSPTVKNLHGWGSGVAVVLHKDNGSLRQLLQKTKSMATITFWHLHITGRGPDKKQGCETENTWRNPIVQNVSRRRAPRGTVSPTPTAVLEVLSLCVVLISQCSCNSPA